MKKKKVVFVGSFKSAAKDGSVGGQMFACRSLIESELSETIEWVLLDSTSPSVPPPSFVNRASRAFLRLNKFIFLVIFKRPESILIFLADGFSFLEKGLMALFGKWLGKKVILAPRSGYIPRDLKESKVLRLFIPFVLKKVDYVICQGESWKSLFKPLIDKGTEGKLLVIENWMDTSLYNELAIQEVRDDLVQVLFLGWVEKSKGAFDAFEAALKITPNATNVRFVFAGDGAGRSVLISKTKESDLTEQIQFPGWVNAEEKRDILLKSDIFVLPSYFEGFPNALMEAMLSSSACVATKVGSIPDVISDGKNGYLIEVGDINELSEILLKLIGDSELRKRIGSAGRERVLLTNTIATAVEKFTKIL